MWAYLARYPGPGRAARRRGCTTRARGSCSASGAFDDYRREFWYDHPDARSRFRRVRGRRARRTDLLLLVDAARGDADGAAGRRPQPARRRRPARRVSRHARGDDSSGAPGLIGSGRRRRASACARALGVPDEVGAVRVRSARSPPRSGSAPILRAFSAIVRERADVHLLLAGDAVGLSRRWPRRLASPDIAVARARHRLLPDEAIGGYLAAADACLCLRWPTALETSASWLHCLAASRPTVISDLAHLVDIPTVDPRGWQRRSPGSGPVAIAIDLLDEEESLRLAMRRLADRPSDCETTLGRAGHVYWKANHTLEPDGRRLPPAVRRWPSDRPAPAARGSAGAFHRGSSAAWRARDRSAVRTRYRRCSGRQRGELARFSYERTTDSNCSSAPATEITRGIPTRNPVRSSAACPRPACRW